MVSWEEVGVGCWPIGKEREITKYPIQFLHNSILSQLAIMPRKL
jgi:hypothetical protein